MERLRGGAPVSKGERVAAARASYRAGQVFETGRYWSDAALAAADLGPRERERALQGTSLEALVDGALKSAPASPQNWVRRAAFQLSAGDVKGARVSLETSLLLGRFMPRLTVPRLRIMIELLHRSADPALEAYIAEQIRIAARTEPLALARFADHGAAEGIAQRTLAGDFALYDAYLRALASVRAQKAKEATAK
ncbi:MULTISPECIES: hypothetical protein [unclassified Sphingomonas]|uniref:hypothetical protein n=1 Tax=unclassified Sphingomonas TaxID=196159 RepID=UPI0012E3557C|nr:MULTISPECIES: hypothetical protein [unclassified Sphingomonas]